MASNSPVDRAHRTKSSERLDAVARRKLKTVEGTAARSAGVWVNQEREVQSATRRIPVAIRHPRDAASDGTAETDC